MRIRQIKPDFWKDARIAELPEGARLFYVGTWQLADDSGTLRWSLAEIGAELYPFDGRHSRERRVERYGSLLAGIGRLHLFDCGHAQVPKMPSHQHLAGSTRRVVTIGTEHSKCGIPATRRDSPQTPAPVRFGSVGQGSVSERARARDESTNGPTKGRRLELVDGEWRRRSETA